MSRPNTKRYFILWGCVCVFLIAMVKPVEAQLSLTKEEKNYIEEKKVITAVSIEGGAPLLLLTQKVR